jgi:hypothetical protein
MSLYRDAHYRAAAMPTCRRLGAHAWDTTRRCVTCGIVDDGWQRPYTPMTGMALAATAQQLATMVPWMPHGGTIPAACKLGHKGHMSRDSRGDLRCGICDTMRSHGPIPDRCACAPCVRAYSLPGGIPEHCRYGHAGRMRRNSQGKLFCSLCRTDAKHRWIARRAA